MVVGPLEMGRGIGCLPTDLVPSGTYVGFIESAPVTGTVDLPYGIAADETAIYQSKHPAPYAYGNG